MRNQWIVSNLTSNNDLLDLPQVPHDGFQNGGAKGVTVVVPPGRYVIRRMLEITQSNVVVKGAGVSAGGRPAVQWLLGGLQCSGRCCVQYVSECGEGQARELNPCVLLLRAQLRARADLRCLVPDRPSCDLLVPIAHCSPARRRSSFQWGSSSCMAH